MKYIENIPDDYKTVEKVELCFDKQGKKINDCSGKIYAKHLKIKFIDTQSQQKFFVLSNKNELYDPFGIDSHREKTLDLLLTEVNQNVFDMYLLYLNTKNSVYFTRANRSMING